MAKLRKKPVVKKRKAKKKVWTGRLKEETSWQKRAAVIRSLHPVARAAMKADQKRKQAFVEDLLLALQEMHIHGEALFGDALEKEQHRDRFGDYGDPSSDVVHVEWEWRDPPFSLTGDLDEVFDKAHEKFSTAVQRIARRYGYEADVVWEGNGTYGVIGCADLLTGGRRRQ